MQKITPFLWFDKQAEEAAKFYISLFNNSKITSVSQMMVTFELEGQPFMALNGGSAFKFTEAISLFVNCGTQQEVNDLWDKLSAGGSTSKCGWLKDKYGLSWQIIPKVLGELNG
jgi:predicted 3-demethylubiquinone-9 3-methyltransferase (glyoxalase superfamily)